MNDCNKCHIYERNLSHQILGQARRDFEAARIFGQLAHEGGKVVSPKFTKERLCYTRGITVTNPFRIFCLTKVFLHIKRTLY
jgi:hypothetical protein